MPQETTEVIIVGAGPSGLTAALALAQHRVKSVILEQSLEADPDPRGVYLNGDAVRILWALGIREQQFADFAGEPKAVHFYKTCITNKDGPFFVMRTYDDALHQALPGGVTHIQPRLENAIAAAAIATGYCDLRRGCKVLSHELLPDERILITYEDQTGSEGAAACRYLIGADGKRGIVRKSFLEPTTSIRQITNPKFQYEGTWVAANLQLTPPTPETHPNLPLWSLGYTPEAVFDLFCPEAWYFCSPPGKPTAGGRFGPKSMRLWRHEFAQPDWNESMDAEALFWDHFSKFITRTHDEYGCSFPFGEVTLPRDCITVLRCRSFTFTHKVVNRWHHRRRILIGDAAHVFPPFGGQGIASGIRDAHQLAWRIAFLQSVPSASTTLVDKILDQWARERRKAVDAATFQTKLNGQLCNGPETWAFYLFRKAVAAYEMLPWVPAVPNGVAKVDRLGFGNLRGGFFLPEYCGGTKFPQVFMQDGGDEVQRTDDALSSGPGMMKLVLLRHDTTAIEKAERLINEHSSLHSLLNTESIAIVDYDRSRRSATSAHKLVRPVTPSNSSSFDVRPGYRKEVLRETLGKRTTFALLRPDFHVFALLHTVAELEDALDKLQDMVTDTDGFPKL